MKPLERLHKGDFNDMMQEWQPDGSVIITLFKQGESKVHKLRVRKLYQFDEEELDVATGKPIAKRDISKSVS